MLAVDALVIGVVPQHTKLVLASALLGVPCRKVGEWHTGNVRVEAEDAEGALVGSSVKLHLSVASIPEFLGMSPVDGIFVVYDVTSRDHWERAKVGTLRHLSFFVAHNVFASSQGECYASGISLCKHSCCACWASLFITQEGA